MIDSYYDTLAPYYKYIYSDWERSVEYQAAALDEVIREYFGDQTSTVLDAACGIGTQSIGLAKLGYKVTGYDLSSGAIQIANQEALSRNLLIDFSVMDMRQAGCVRQGRSTSANMISFLLVIMRFPICSVRKRFWMLLRGFIKQQRRVEVA